MYQTIQWERYYLWSMKIGNRDLCKRISLIKCYMSSLPILNIYPYNNAVIPISTTQVHLS